MNQNHYETFLKSVGANIRQMRIERSLTMEQLANEAEIEYRQLGRIERGEINTTIISLLRIANILKVDTADFFKVNQTSD